MRASFFMPLGLRQTKKRNIDGFLPTSGIDVYLANIKREEVPAEYFCRHFLLRKKASKKNHEGAVCRGISGEKQKCHPAGQQAGWLVLGRLGRADRQPFLTSEM